MANSWPRWSSRLQGEAVPQYFIRTDMWDVKVRGSLSSSVCGMVEFRILRGRTWVNSRTSSPEFRRAGCDFRGLLAKVPWRMAIESCLFLRMCNVTGTFSHYKLRLIWGRKQRRTDSCSKGEYTMMWIVRASFTVILDCMEFISVTKKPI